MTDVLSALTPEEQAAIARLRHWTGLPLVACGGSYHSVGAATDADLVCDACGWLRQENARLLERVQWFEASGGVTAHTRVFAEMSRAEQAETLAARYKAGLRDLLDAIPVETAAADPPLQAWMASAEAALAEEP